MQPDDPVCLCFRVSQRKLVNYCRREKPAVASQLADCLGAGTGCGWCVPFLARLHEEVSRGVEEPLRACDPSGYAQARQRYRTTGDRALAPDPASAQAPADDPAAPPTSRPGPAPPTETDS
ncbi:MAG: (2Fe-2S)-binding protein [Planctomycetota bacterium]